MAGLSSDKSPKLPLIHLLPNLLTITAICAGLTAIRFGYQGNFEGAVRLVLLACVLDGLDGRLARLLKCDSAVGAELDSLADFLNFGVAPGLIIHAWALQDFSGIGWLAVLGYAICCVLRLVRFNVSLASEEETNSDFFVGLPSPAGAVLAMLPMYISFLFSNIPLAPPAFIAVYLLIVGLLMISRLPTYSFKNISISREDIRYLLLGTVLTVAALLTYLWITLIFVSLAYVVGLFLAGFSVIKSKNNSGADSPDP